MPARPHPPTRLQAIAVALAPGVLVAATGVGAGDLVTSGLVGSEVGVVVLWGAVLGAVMKWTAAEGIARWQMGTGMTVLEGWATRLGRPLAWCFLGYFVVWSFGVGAALINASGIAGAALVPLGDPSRAKIIWGIVHSLLGVAIVWIGGFRWFERAMAASIAVMSVAVLLTALLSRPDWGAVVRGMFVPAIPSGGGKKLLMIVGGVGGTVTLLSYGYWIGEVGRRGAEGLRSSRIDLAAGYTLTAFFGLAMIVIGSRVEISASGGDVAVRLAEQLSSTLGPAGGWLFLAGFWGAVFSSLLGVWQSAPYLFADWQAIRRGRPTEQRTAHRLAQTWDYRLWLTAIALVPMIALVWDVRQVQLTYAVLGSLFMPLLALALLVMNNRADWVGPAFRNGLLANVILLATLAFFAYVGGLEIVEKLSSP